MNPVFSALSFVLRGNPNLLILDYADKDAFRELWFNGLESTNPIIAKHQANWDNKNQVLLVVGEAPPDEVGTLVHSSLKGINFRDHLTATSWAAAWRLKFPDAKAKIVVLSSNPPEAGSTVAQALGTLLGARAANNSALVPGTNLLRSPSLAVLCHALETASEPILKLSPAIRSMLRTILWDGLTSDREGHHAVSNVLGALLLSSQVGKGHTHPGEPWVQDYLLALVQACGVDANTDQVKVKEDRGYQNWASRDLQREIGAAVLLDDMADIWEYFLRGALGFVGGMEVPNTGRSFRDSFVNSISVLFNKTILNLPECLTKVLKENRRCLTAADLVPGDHRFDSEFVLFLDLRLFAANDKQTANQFHQKLVALGRQLLAQKIRPLPWLDARRFIEFERELDGDEIAGHPRETLLPRILSLLDPTLPIVIFSSTHRTELIDPFRDYGNIITTFRKPVLTGLTQNWDNVVKELHADFGAALEEAANILRVRRNLARLIITKSVALPHQSASGHRRIIEIYIDESGDPFNERDPGFAVGGIMLQHENDEAQKAFHGRINQSPVKWGVSDYPPDRIRANEVDDKLPLISFYPKKPTPNGAQETEALNFVASALGEKSRVAAFALIDPDLLRFCNDTRLDSAILFDRNSLDNVYHFLLRTNLETLLFEHPWIDLKTDSLFIHVATRQQTVNNPRTQKIWQQAYGIDFKERSGIWQYTSLEMGSVYRLVGELLQARGILNKQPDIVMARGVTLNDYEDIVSKWQAKVPKDTINRQLFNPARLDPNQIHYLADWIVRMALYRQSNQMPLCVGEWFEAGYIQPVTGEFLALLDACRQANAGKSVRRLSKIKLTPEDSVRNGWRGERFLRQTASAWPDALSGDDLRALFRESKVRAQATRPRQTVSAAPVPKRIDLAAPKVEAAPIRWRVLIEATVGCDKQSIETALESNSSIPRPTAIRIFESEEKVEFILDLDSADGVSKFMETPIEIGGARLKVADATLPENYRLMSPVPTAQD